MFREHPLDPKRSIGWVKCWAVVRLSIVTLTVAMTVGCAALTREEAEEALEELSLATTADALVGNTVDIGTHFTLGGAVEAAADELRAFVNAQLPCATVEVAESRVNIEYGSKGLCLYRGQIFEGIHEVAIEAVNASSVRLAHRWSSFTNGDLILDGTAEVTWSSEDPSRRVRHKLDWSRSSDGSLRRGRGDRTQRPLSPGGLASGIVTEGDRSWESDTGQWSLTLDGVEARWVDPVPQAGVLRLDTPFGKALDASFERLSETTIRVTVESGARAYEFDVTRLGLD